MKGSAVIFAVMLLFAIQVSPQKAADLAIINGKVWTVDPKAPNAEAVAVADGKIIAVGANDKISRYVSDSTNVINAEGKLVLPGFNDAHVHFVAIGNKFSTFRFEGVETAGQFREQIAYYTRFLPSGRWIIGSGIPAQLWDSLGKNDPSFDAVSSLNPLFLYGSDNNAAFANKKAFELAGISGRTAGIVRDKEFEKIRKIVPADHTRNWAEIAETASNYAVSFGITSVQDMSSDDHSALYRKLAAEDRLKVRIYDCLGLPEYRRLMSLGTKAAADDLMVRSGCIKTTAEVEGNGIRALFNEVAEADKAGMQVIVHAIGEKQVTNAISAMDTAQRSNKRRDRRFRIEHAEGMSASLILRQLDLDIIASFQPYLFGGRTAYYDRFINGRIALGSDAPMTDIDPLLGIVSAVSNSANGIGWEDAVRAYTAGSAYAEYQEKVKGTIEIGKFADIIILSANTISGNLISNKGLFVKKTIIGGRVAYTAPE